MRRITHLTLGAAVTVPVVLDQPWPLAVGCLVLGGIGGGMPDWIDFQSGLRKPFTPRHRGASHGLPVMAASLLLLAIAILVIRDRIPEWPGEFDLFDGSGIWIALFAFGLGWLSHLASDACTISGIQPLLPFARWRCWLMPRPLRSRSDGYLDKLVRLGALTVLSFGLVLMTTRWWVG